MQLTTTHTKKINNCYCLGMSMIKYILSDRCLWRSSLLFLCLSILALRWYVNFLGSVKTFLEMWDQPWLSFVVITSRNYFSFLLNLSRKNVILLQYSPVHCTLRQPYPSPTVSMDARTDVYLYGDVVTKFSRLDGLTKSLRKRVPLLNN